MMQDTLGIKVYGPALARDDSRPIVVVHAMERALPGLRLEWTVSDDHQLLHLPQRDAWLAQARRSGGIPLICNNDEGHPIALFGLELSARSGPGGQALLEIHADVPLHTTVLAVLVDMMEAVAEGANASWGHATPFRASAEIAAQTTHPHTPGLPPRGLPALKLPEMIGSPEIPHRLGWLNYWSAAAARAIGFPDPAQDADLLSRSQRTARGGWVVQLTDAPLDLDKPDHLIAVVRAYKRFPAIGGRAAP
ncbi:DUF5953 family protein [Corallococcus macrosporus]|uniref:Uncharacterized protein n=1 Tax=Corallococcus macrosporus DSM 14697 TaxID=1189310 RepID=A0A250JQH5_9BACT|nr:DUF5953 family protein [Corallococcus macrosporus]ATB45376.1 hypothetical protein MYMAC_000961 [Corallococcus macrosporus DSM 14697]